MKIRVVFQGPVVVKMSSRLRIVSVFKLHSFFPGNLAFFDDKLTSNFE